MEEKTEEKLEEQVSEQEEQLEEEQVLDHEIIIAIKEQLNEEKWTRTAIENYAKKNFVDLDDYINRAFEENIEEDLYDVCLNHLAHTQQSIIALYVIGMISLKKDAFDLSPLYKVINQFREYKKYNIVEYLSEKIIEENGDDKFVLNTLKDVYELTNNNEELYKIWERLVKIDYDNGVIAQKLAALREEQDNEEEAIYYYKQALKRFARKHSMSYVEELWKKLLEFIPLDLDFFYLIEKELVKHNETEAADLLKLNVDYAINENKIDDAIDLLIKVLKYNPKDKEMRNKLSDCFKIKYKDHSQLTEYLKMSSLNQTWKNFETALDEFQRRIAFDVGNFVHHRHWGIGKIIDLNETHMFIDFEKKKHHRMSLNMALNSLKVLPRDHIWILKQEKLEELQDESPEGIENTLKILLKSLDNEASRKEIKAELVPGIVPAKSWTKWWTKAKKIIKTSALIGQSPTKKDVYIFRENPLSFEEETLKNFNSVANFDDKFKIFIEYYEVIYKDRDNNDDWENRHDVLVELLEYFIEVCNKSDMLDDRVIKSFLLLKKVRKEFDDISIDIQLNPNTVFKELDMDTVELIFNRIQNQDFKKMFLLQLKKRRSDWDKVYIVLATSTGVTKAHNVIMDGLLSAGKNDAIKYITDELISNQRKNLEAYLWCIKTIFSEKELMEITELDEESTVLNLLRMLDILNKDIENKKKVTYNKKMHSQIVELITKDDRLDKIVDRMHKEERKDDCQKLAALLRGTISLKEKTKSKLLKHIYDYYPDLEKEQEEKRESIDTFIVTKEAYDRKQKEFQKLIHEEIPKNSLDIGKAQEKGDLKENAEYQMALERQKQLQTMSAKLDVELKKAKILDFSKVNASKISVGTKVELLNMKTKQKETYTILGEWDSDIENNVISYLSPLGKSLIGGKKAETIIFSHEGNETEYKVIKIKKANSSKKKSGSK